MKNTIFILGSENCGVCKLILEFLEAINDNDYNIKFYNLLDKENYEFMLEKNLTDVYRIHFPGIYVFDGIHYIRLNNSILLQNAMMFREINKVNRLKIL